MLQLYVRGRQARRSGYDITTCPWLNDREGLVRLLGRKHKPFNDMTSAPIPDADCAWCKGWASMEAEMFREATGGDNGDAA